VHDPLFSPEEIAATGLDAPRAFPMPCDALVVQAWHDAYASLDLRTFPRLRAVLDGRGALAREDVTAAGALYVVIGG
jgi:hypothetical protein